jgi:4-amino-4-deoxy-L-arabinose transferase-like glycosyltransferase
VLIWSAIYMSRLTRLPMVGEEPRVAEMAEEMYETGDWVVPRQQRQPFPERPPMTTWAVAVMGLVHGELDALAVRLPSVVAVLLTSLLVYGYSRQFMSLPSALAAGLIYVSMGQVLQIGRMGESEAVFTLLVSASLMTWHLGYVRGWHPAWTWIAGFGLAAVAAYVKGLQAPVYFSVITGVYLIHRHDWRYLIGWPFMAGAAVFVAIVAVWQIPFYLRTDWASVKAIWTGLISDRLSPWGLAEHVATYPLETFACLLPWSPLLVALVHRETRELLHEKWPLALFLYTAVIVTYPSVLLATGAQSRYYMPLYPCIAVLIALVIDRCAASQPGRYPRHAWHQFLLLSSTIVSVGGLAILALSLLPAHRTGAASQPLWLGLSFALLAAGVVYVLWTCYRAGTPRMRTAAVASIALFVGMAYTGVMINVHAARWHDPTAAVASLKERVPVPESLVSLGPIEHRFAYFYKAPIPEVAWPLTVGDLPEDVEYFVFMRYAGDTAESRSAGRGRVWTKTPGTLPFEWEEVTSIFCDRSKRPGDLPRVVLGRVIRPLQPAVVDVTKPRATTARQDSPSQQK